MRPDQLQRFAPVPKLAPRSVRPRDALPVPALVTGDPDEATRHGWARAALASMVLTDRKPAKSSSWRPWAALALLAWLGMASLVVANAGREPAVVVTELRP